MSRDHWDDPEDRDPSEDARARRHRRRHRRRSRRSLTPEEREMRAAQRRANARIGFATHFVAYASVCTFLLAVRGPRAAFITALGWGIGIALHYFSAIAAPRMRRRLLEREVQRQVAADVPRERRTVSDKHVRSLEDLSAEVAHEIRNPITAAKSLVQQMGEDPASAENVAYAKVALEELDRVERSVAHLLRYAREEDLHLSQVRLVSLIDSALEGFRERIAAQRVRLVREVGSDAVLRGDAEKLRRVLINLVNNALDALAEGHSRDPLLEVLAGENLAGTECWVRVRDNGPGIDATTLARIWSPFKSSTKATGTGLGLAISKKVVDAHGGSIEVTSQPGAGAEFTITIPKQAPAT